jgi:hypothetical protein
MASRIDEAQAGPLMQRPRRATVIAVAVLGLSVWFLLGPATPEVPFGGEIRGFRPRNCCSMAVRITIHNRGVRASEGMCWLTVFDASGRKGGGFIESRGPLPPGTSQVLSGRSTYTNGGPSSLQTWWWTSASKVTSFQPRDSAITSDLRSRVGQSERAPRSKGTNLIHSFFEVSK